MEDFALSPNLVELSAGRTVFGRFTLLRLLGRGGMGVVWLARDEVLEREVALKFLNQLGGLDTQALAELKAETRRALELTHPNIVRVYDFWEEDGLGAISMEYVEGASLATLRLEQPERVFQPAALRAWLGQLCAGLSHAHEQGKVLHRDLKPANILIAKNGVVKVTDFGIATTLSEATIRLSATATSLSGAGTPAYMSPQQLSGAHAAVTDDVYSFGAMVYELLTGQPPFFSGDIVAQVHTKIPESVAKRRAALGLSGDTVPPLWVDTLAACLAKDPWRRPQSMRDVAKGLGIVLEAPRENRQGRMRPPTPPPAVVPEEPSFARYHLWRLSNLLFEQVGLVMKLGVLGLLFLVYWYNVVYSPRARTERAQQARLEEARLDRSDLPGTLILTSIPAGASVRILTEGGLPVANSAESPTPFKRELKPGACLVELSLPGYHRVRRTVQIRPRKDVPAEVEMELRPEGTEGEEATPGRVHQVPDLGMTMQWVSPGSFRMGSEHRGFAGSVAQVTLTKGFWLCTTEVTGNQFVTLMNARQLRYVANDCAVAQVDHEQAMKYCEVLTQRERKAGRLPDGYAYSLPTEAQWEYACRAGSTGEFEGEVGELAWYVRNSGRSSSRVAQLKPNAWGLYDMHGNVAEWCLDKFGPTPSGVLTDPYGILPSGYYVVRGGGFEDSASNCSSSARFGEFPVTAQDDIGFRVALVPIW